LTFLKILLALFSLKEQQKSESNFVSLVYLVP